MQIIDYNIQNESKQTKYFVKYIDKIESILKIMLIVMIY